MYRIIYAFVLFFALTLSEVNGQDLLQHLTSKTWNGSGTLMGGEATFEMQWSMTLDNKFVHLKFKNQRGTNSNGTFVFKAHAYYKFKSDGTIEGMWFDSRGIYFPLTGTHNSNELIINWGTPETEQGRTVYTFKGKDEIEVRDYILTGDKYGLFGRASYK